MAIPQTLTDFLASQPTLKLIHRSDPDFNTTKLGFIACPDIPLLIVRPQNEKDAAAVIGHLTATSVPFTIRAGGHDMSTRFAAQDTVQIDLRDIAHVHVAKDRVSARIGGGVLTKDLLDALAKEGLMAVFPNAATVGWCAWAMNGGYGIMAGRYGLGCDQIIGARVILANGKIVDADERLLKALRGAGTAFGAIVELQIKVLPLTKVLQSLPPPFLGRHSKLETDHGVHRSPLLASNPIPRDLYFQPFMMPSPSGPPSFALQFVWSAPPCDEQSWWLDKLTALVPGGNASVGPVTPAEHTAQLSKTVDFKNIPGGESRTVCAKGLVLSREAAQVVARNCALIQPEWGACFIHMLHGDSVNTGKQHPPSVFANRETSLMMEILGLSFQDEGAKEAAAAWCRNMYDEMSKVEGIM
ncbi:FAD binding domain-containing protein [Sarocladium implicatum]|nr:FAD binding domain-containing protein [Sarocladium implicatum]